MKSKEHLTKIDSWIGNSAVFELITDKDRLQTLISNIENSRGGIKIEILQFLSIYSAYNNLENKRFYLIEKLAATDNRNDRKVILQQLESVEKDQNNFIRNTLQIAHVFTKTALKGDLERAAKHFFEGDILQADADLNLNRIQGDQEKYLAWVEAKQKLEVAYDSLEENATEFKIKAQLTMLNMEINAPENRFQKAITLFFRGQTSAECTKRVIFIAEFSFDHGIFLLVNKEYNNAPIQFEKALSHYRELIEKDSNKYSWLFCDTLNNLAITYKARHEFEKTEAYYMEVLNTVQGLFHLDPITYKSQLAMIINNVAEFKRFRHEFDGAKNWFQKAIGYYRELADDEPESYLPYLAAALSNIANVLVLTKDFDEAEDYNKEALRITR